MAVADYDASGPIARAGRSLRAMPEMGWDDLEERVIAAVRSTPRGGWPLAVVDPDPGPPRGTIVITDLALKASVVNVLRDDPDYAVGAIEVAVDEMSVRGVRLELTGRYDTDLHATAQRALQRCAQVVDEVIGDAGAIPIEVVVTDVHR